MATVYLATIDGPEGFQRRVAIKRLHPHLAADTDATKLFLDEARLAALIHHENVVPTLDAVHDSGEPLIVMEHVEGTTLSALLAAVGPLPIDIACGIATAMCRGLHAAHEARDQTGSPIGLVHRDVSPQNVLMSVEGSVKIVDFGIAKAKGRWATTQDGQIKGKLRYMAPEQLRRAPIDRRADIYAVSAVLWEMLTGHPLVDADNEGALVLQIVGGAIVPPSSARPDVPSALDALILRGLAIAPERRFATAAEMAESLEACEGPTPHAAMARFASAKVTPLSFAPKAKPVAADKALPLDAPASDDTVRLSPARKAPDGDNDATKLAATSAFETTASPSQQRGATMKSIAFVAFAATAVVVAWTALRGSREGAVSLATGNALQKAVRATEASPRPAIAVAPSAEVTPSTVPSSSSPVAPTSRIANANAERARTGSPSAKAPLTCNPPWTVDKTGVRTYKRECVKR